MSAVEGLLAVQILVSALGPPPGNLAKNHFQKKNKAHFPFLLSISQYPNQIAKLLFLELLAQVSDLSH